MPSMARTSAPTTAMDLCAVTVRPTRGAAELRHRNRPAETHRCPGSHGIVGKGLPHVALRGDVRAAPGGWRLVSFKLGARDRWIGRSDGQRVRRRRLVADNCRFAALVPGKVPNLASRVPGPCQHDMVGVRCKTPFLRLRGRKSGSDFFERRVSGAGVALSGADSV